MEMKENEKRKKVIKGLECCMSGQPDGLGCSRVPCPYNQFEDCEGILHRDALALLKAQEPVKPMLARGWYWCGGVGCRNSLTSARDDDSPVRKPNYCEKCGRPVKWE